MSGKKWTTKRQEKLREVDRIFQNAPLSKFYWEFAQEEDNLPIERNDIVSSGPVDRVKHP